MEKEPLEDALQGLDGKLSQLGEEIVIARLASLVEGDEKKHFLHVYNKNDLLLGLKSQVSRVG